MHHRKYLTVFLLLLAFWCIGIFSPALFHHKEAFILVKPLLNQFYATVCHQDNDKIIKIFDQSILVCSRCLGIYLGLFSEAVLSFFILHRKFVYELMLLTSFILLGDVLLSTFNFYTYSKTAALITGFLFGAALLSFVVSTLNNLNYLSHEE